MVATISHYELFGLQPNATAAEIKKAYYKMAQVVHPDKNIYGAIIMQKMNEAKEVLLDDAKRREYDAGELRDHQMGRSNANAIEIRRQLSVVQIQLRESQRQHAETQQKYYSLNRENRDLKADLYDKDRSIKDKDWKIQSSDQRIRDLEAVTRYKDQQRAYLEQEKESLTKKNHNQSRHISSLEGKISWLNRTVKKESSKSVCYRCDGKAVGNNCSLCLGSGVVQGIWTKCLSCSGVGSFQTLKGHQEVKCDICYGVGARKGVLSVVCFKCEGDTNQECSVCYKGKLRGFNIRLCPFCGGQDANCENCLGRAYVSCRCGAVCKGHGPKEVTFSSLQQCLFASGANKENGNWKGFHFTSWKTPSSSLQQASKIPFV